MTTPVDLDHLEAKRAAATQGEWRTYSEPGVRWDDPMACGYDSREHHRGAPYYCTGPRCDTSEAAEADAKYIAATHNALPALIAEVRRLRALRDNVTKHCGNTPACRFRPAEVTHDGKAITVMNSADAHRLSAALAELYALREVVHATEGYAQVRHAPGEDEAFADVLTALAKVPR